MQPIKLDCAVCVLDPVKLIMYFVQLKYLR